MVQSKICEKKINCKICFRNIIAHQWYARECMQHPPWIIWPSFEIVPVENGGQWRSRTCLSPSNYHVLVVFSCASNPTVCGSEMLGDLLAVAPPDGEKNTCLYYTWIIGDHHPVYNHFYCWKFIEILKPPNESQYSGEIHWVLPPQPLLQKGGLKLTLRPCKLWG